MLVKAGKTDVSCEVFVANATTGAPATGLAYNSSGIDLKYRREFEAAVSITEATLAALTTAHADGGFLEIGNGWYRLDLPDDAVDTAGSSTSVVVYGTITGYVVYGPVIQLVAFDPADTVRLGLTALPNAAAEASGGLVTRGTGTGQISVSSGQVILQTGTGTGQLDFTSGRVKADAVYFGGSAGTFSSGRPEVNTTHAAGTAWGSGAITAAVFAADAITAAKLHSDVTTELQSGLATASAVQDALDGIGLINTVTTKLDDTLEDDAGTYRFTTNALEQAPSGTGASAATIADAVWDEVLSSGHAVADSAAVRLSDILVDTAVIGATGGGLTSLASAANLTTLTNYVDTEVAAIKTKTDFLPSATAGAAGGVFIAGTNAATTITTGLTTTFTGNLTGSVGSVASGGIAAASFASDAITAAKLASDVGTEIANAILAAGDVDGFTVEQTLKLILSSAAAKLAGAATSTVTIRAADDSKTRITATTDADGNRTAVTLDATG